MQAGTILRGMQAQRLEATSHRTPRQGYADPVLLAGMVAIVLTVAMLLAMVPGFAGVAVDTSAMPRPQPAPGPVVVNALAR